MLAIFLALPNGIPCADTFRRVFERIHPKQFEQCFEQWVQQLVNDLGIQVIAIDGKSLKGLYDRESGSKALYLLSAWATEHRLALAQSKVQNKSNEITAIPALLELLDIKGCIVTFEEDDCRVRSLHAPHNLALVRRFALNALNCESTLKCCYLPFPFVPKLDSYRIREHIYTCSSVQ